MKLDVAAAQRAMQEKLAKPLSLDMTQAADQLRLR